MIGDASGWHTACCDLVLASTCNDSAWRRGITASCPTAGNIAYMYVPFTIPVLAVVTCSAVSVPGVKLAPASRPRTWAVALDTRYALMIGLVMVVLSPWVMSNSEPVWLRAATTSVLGCTGVARAPSAAAATATYAMPLCHAHTVGYVARPDARSAPINHQQQFIVSRCIHRAKCSVHSVGPLTTQQHKSQNKLAELNE